MKKEKPRGERIAHAGSPDFTLFHHKLSRLRNFRLFLGVDLLVIYP